MASRLNFSFSLEPPCEEKPRKWLLASLGGSRFMISPLTSSILLPLSPVLTTVHLLVPVYLESLCIWKQTCVY